MTEFGERGSHTAPQLGNNGFTNYPEAGHGLDRAWPIYRGVITENQDRETYQMDFVDVGISTKNAFRPGTLIEILLGEPISPDASALDRAATARERATNFILKFRVGEGDSITFAEEPEYLTFQKFDRYCLVSDPEFREFGISNPLVDDPMLNYRLRADQPVILTAEGNDGSMVIEELPGVVVDVGIDGQFMRGTREDYAYAERVKYD